MISQSTHYDGIEKAIRTVMACCPAGSPGRKEGLKNWTRYVDLAAFTKEQKVNLRDMMGLMERSK